MTFFSFSVISLPRKKVVCRWSRTLPSDIKYLPFQQTQLVSLILSQVLPSDLFFLVLFLMVFAFPVA